MLLPWEGQGEGGRFVFNISLFIGFLFSMKRFSIEAYQMFLLQAISLQIKSILELIEDSEKLISILNS